ncbi:hypothetical protein AKJ09_05656 [Labilithrix luteola]|uniref:Uncharacterized protein n=1 Tax=Labilithrix luteola TaxID=1391654 RepID=A0A0K1PZS4_9BACT|nr:hypothetical protein AKJ09_05656 [Labilithrix luteola]
MSLEIVLFENDKEVSSRWLAFTPTLRECAHVGAGEANLRSPALSPIVKIRYDAKCSFSTMNSAF